MLKLDAKFDADSLLYSFSHFECDDHTVHVLTKRRLTVALLVQQRQHCTHMCITGHSIWLPNYIDVAQTVFLILIMAGSFPDSPRIHVHIVRQLHV